MANLLWGKVYFKQTFAGYLRQEPGERYTFTYDDSYLSGNNPPIAYTLPLQTEPHINENSVPAFFDNLIAEGWLEQAQQRLLRKRQCSRFELLLAFGHDCAGAVSVIDPEPEKLSTNMIDHNDPAELAIYQNRASLSGIQPKFLLTKTRGKLLVTEQGQASTHIAKLPSTTINDIIYNEWLTINACNTLLPKDDFVDAQLMSLPGFSEEALVIKRFDRTENGDKIHFEEFNQLLNHQSKQKYDGAYRDMADCILDNQHCSNAEAYRLYKRILVGILIGNTDMHLKNFAMFNDNNHFTLTPNYDLVSAAIYKPYQYLALTLDGAADRPISTLKPKHLIALGEAFSLHHDAIAMAVSEIQTRIDAAKDTLAERGKSKNTLKDKIITMMEKRWNGTFSSIGRQLSKPQ